MLRWNPHFHAIVLEGGFDEESALLLCPVLRTPATSLKKVRDEWFKGPVLLSTTYPEHYVLMLHEMEVTHRDRVRVDRENLILYGNVGTEKTHLAAALGIEPARQAGVWRSPAPPRL